MKNVIATKRKEKGMTQQELGDLIGISDRVISKWETGKSVPNTSMIKPLCEALGITINELFEEKEETKTLEQITEADLKVKYKNLLIVSLLFEIISSIIISLGRFMYNWLVYSSRHIGIIFIVVGAILIIIGTGYSIMTRNKIINDYSKTKGLDKKYVNTVTSGLIICTFAISCVFIFLHKLEVSEELIILSIVIFILILVSMPVYILNKKR